jgi:hypothetical protein
MTPEGNNQTGETDSIEELRSLLVRNYDQTISYEEASEIGDTLVSFFELLAE